MKRLMRLLWILCAVFLATNSIAELIAAEIPAPQFGEPVAVDEDDDPIMALLPQIDRQVQAYLTADGLAIGDAYAGFRPLTAEPDEDGAAIIAIGDLYTAPMRQDLLDFDQFDEIQWLDKRAVVMLRKESAGWVLVSVSFDDELVMENASAAYYAETMLTATAVDGSWMVQYPAIFGTLISSTDDDGCIGSASISGDIDGKQASFFVGSRSNNSRMTVLIQAMELQARYPGETVETNEASGVMCVRHYGDDVCVAEYVIVTETTVYHAKMTWDPSMNSDFVLYSEYVMNSFSADELGIG